MASPMWQNFQPDEDTTRTILRFVALLADDQNLRATVKGSVLGGIGVGAVATTMSLLLGPIGLLVGGVAGGIAGYAIAKDRYMPLSKVFYEMPLEKQQRLRYHLEIVMRNVDVKDVLGLIALMASDTTIKAKIITSIIAFAARELGVSVLQ